MKTGNITYSVHRNQRPGHLTIAFQLGKKPLVFGRAAWRIDKARLAALWESIRGGVEGRYHAGVDSTFFSLDLPNPKGQYADDDTLWDSELVECILENPERYGFLSPPGKEAPSEA